MEEKKEVKMPKTSGSYFTNGGVRFEMSRCCDASVTQTKGGVIWKICSKCGSEIKQDVYG
jgi:hypothetical protein